MYRSIGSNAVVFESKFGPVIPKIIVLDDDVDAANTPEVVWAFATRSRPVTGVVFFKSESTSPLVAFLDTAEKGSFHTSKVVYDALAPDSWGEGMPPRAPVRHNYPKDLQERVLNRWHEYGYP